MSSSEENGSRATVALVNSKVETVDAKITGLHQLIEAEFEKLRPLPDAVHSLSERMGWVEKRITDLEKDNDSRQGWRKVTLPQILIGVVGLAIAVANIVVLLSVN